MSYASIDPNKTALLFFDMLNAYFHAGTEEDWAAAKPMVDNCRLVLDAARGAGIPVFFARADHRHDGLDSALLYNDTDVRGTPWPDPEDRPFKPYLMIYAGDWSSQVIPELDPRPDDYFIAKHRWSAFHQTHLEPQPPHQRHRHHHPLRRRDRRGHRFHRLLRPRHGLQPRHRQRRLPSREPGQSRQLMTRMFPFMARVRTASEVVGMIGAAS